MQVQEKFKMVIGVAVLIEQAGKTLLLKRGLTSMWPGYYCNVGGHVDGSETMREAACREAFEEVGIVIKPQDLHFVHVVHRYHELGESVCFFFKASHYEGTPYNKEPKKHDEILWAPYHNLPEPLFPTFKTYLENTDSYYSEFGWHRREN